MSGRIPLRLSTPPLSAVARRQLSARTGEAPIIDRVLSNDKEVDVITRKLVLAGVSALALTPGVAWACTDNGHLGPDGPPGATGVTGATGTTGSTGTSGVTSAPLRSAHFRKAHSAHARKSAARGQR